MDGAEVSEVLSKVFRGFAQLHTPISEFLAGSFHFSQSTAAISCAGAKMPQTA